MRLVTVFEYWRPEDAKFGDPYHKREVGKGKFHMFGTNCTETEHSIGTWTSAIVEMPDGTVLNVDVEMIKFNDAPLEAE